MSEKFPISNVQLLALKREREVGGGEVNYACNKFQCVVV